MKRRSPTWFFFALLTLLFLLSVAAPLAWDRPQATTGLPLPAANLPAPPAAEAPPVTVHALPEVEPPPAVATREIFAPTPEPRVFPDEIDPAPPLGDLFAPEPPLGDAAPQPPSNAASETDDRRPIDADAARDATIKVPGAGLFPKPQALLRQLKPLGDDPRTAPWAHEVERQLDELSLCRPSETARAAQSLRELRASARAVPDLVEKLASEGQRSNLRRTAYALTRRLDLWNAAVAAAGQPGTPKSLPDVMLEHPRDRLAMIPAVRVTPDHALGSDAGGRSSRRRGGLLSRFEGRHADREPWRHATTLSEIAAENADPVARLLEDIERYEELRLASDAFRITASLKSLAESSRPEARQLVDYVDTHYRNANIRITATGVLLNRILPPLQSIDGDVYEYIAGAEVVGQHTVFPVLGIQLIPDPTRLHVALEAQGLIASDTVASSGPAVIRNEGAADFRVFQPLALSRDGLARGEVQAEADSRNDMVGVGTDYDDILLLGPLMRRLATRQANKQQYTAQWEVEQKIVAEAEDRFEKQLGPRVDKWVANFQNRVWIPLKKLELGPTPIELSTSDERILARIRVGHVDQLAAHTARPRAPADSLASMQIHESLLNNIFEQLDFNGQTLTLPDIYRRVAGLMTPGATNVPDSLPTSVRIRFAEQDAVRVRCKDGRVELVLNLDEVRKGNERWEHLLVRAFYEPAGTGLDARLVRTAPVELAGDRINTRSQFALRGAFSKLLSTSRSVSLVPAKLVENPRLADLEVTQFQIRDGWIGVALGPRYGTGGTTQSRRDQAALPRWQEADHVERR